jgi:RNA polymerase sigma factor (sigma-70 family)
MSTVEFNQLLVHHSDFLKPFAVTLTRDQESAKDLFQETLYRALANKEKYGQGTNLKAWLFTIMRNIFINNYRRNARHTIVYEGATTDFTGEKLSRSLSEFADGGLMLKEINQALYHLPAIFRNPFILYFQGYKYHEIAEMLSEPLGTVKSRIHFARKLLKQKIQRN